MTPKRNLYEVLGLSKDASAHDLKKAYHRLALKHHPDKNPGDKEAEERFKEAADAYKILSDATQRANYDRSGIEDFQRSESGASQRHDFRGFNNVEEIFSTFGDLFGTFFAGRVGGAKNARGADRKIALSLPFSEAVWGARKDLRITQQVNCSTCNGVGGAKVESCLPCQGKGVIPHPQGFFVVQITCTSCNGAGKRVKDPCSKCQGHGIRSTDSSLKLVIPPGVQAGQILRVAGKGDVVPGGNLPGDLFITLLVGTDHRFHREGADIASTISLSFAQAALGAEIVIDTLEENGVGTAVLELAPGTQPGDVLVRRGQGGPRQDGLGRGDHILKFKVEVPKKLTVRQEALLRDFAKEEEPCRTKKKKR